MPGKIVFSGKDYGSQSSSVNIPTIDVDAAGYDNFIGVGVPSLLAAINGVLLHDLDGQQVSVLSVPAGAKATSPAAQREQKWMVVCSFTNNSVPGTFKIELPMADPAFLSPDSENLDLSSTEGAALKTQLETWGRSKYGDAITVQYAKLVGRNI